MSSAQPSLTVQRAHAVLMQYRPDPCGRGFRSTSLPDEMAIDLIADLLHWVHARDADPDDVLGRAEMHYLAEVGAETA